MTSAQHMSTSGERYTPPWLVEWARQILGGIDLDPCSCAAAQTVVQADTYYDRDGLSRPWYGRMLINPPGRCTGDYEGCGPVLWSSPSGRSRASRGRPRRSCSCGLVRAFWARSVTQVSLGRVDAIMWIGYSLEQLAMLQSTSCGGPLRWPTAVLRRRVAYLGPDLQPMRPPPHSSYVTLVARPSADAADMAYRMASSPMLEMRMARSPIASESSIPPGWQ